jgi:uncharacterized protein (DUF1015 family)
MAIIRPFRGIHYSKRFVHDASTVVIPPYDNIPAGMESVYMARSPYNFAHVLLPKSAEDDYKQSKETLQKWREVGVLEEDATPSFYLYQQSFELRGVKHQRQTLMCTVQLGDYAEGAVKPHENTFGKHKKDRLQILRSTQCNLSHVFGMVKDQQGFLSSTFERFAFETPLLTGKTDDGAEHALWRVPTDKAKGIVEFFESKSIYIVDGHHRYESALAYAKELGVVGKVDHPAAHMLFAIANCYDPALVVLPTHRLLRTAEGTAPDLVKMGERFEIHKFAESELEAFTTTRPEHSVQAPSFALYAHGELYLCTPRDWASASGKAGKALPKLPVWWSDEVFLRDYAGINDDNRGDRVAYYKDASELWAKRDSARALVFHAPPSVMDVTSVADEKEFMPQKSTYFFPKLAAGFVFRALS